MAGFNQAGIKAVVIGGGTGSFTILSALKNYIARITAVVNMADSGGSTGVLRDELGVLPPGDVRQCLVALSRSSKMMRELFNYRFEEGTFSGHAFGNLLLSALEKTTGDFGTAVKMAGEVLNIQGQVLPVTTKNMNLCLKKPNGEVVKGEIQIAEMKLPKLPKLYLEPTGILNKDVARAIEQADVIIVAPGHLYGTLAPALLVSGMKQALAKAKAKKIYICNLMTKPGQTDGFRVKDFAAEIERFVGKAFLNYVVYNSSKPSKHLLERYAQEGETWVGYNETDFDGVHYRAIGVDLLSRTITTPKPGDKLLRRTLIRHDSDKVARTIMSIYFTSEV